MKFTSMARICLSILAAFVCIVALPTAHAGPKTDRAVSGIMASESNSWENAAKEKFDERYRRLVITGFFKGVDGHPRRYRLYKKLGQDQGLVVFLSGFSEHIEKYEAMFTSLHEFPSSPVPASETLADLPLSFLNIDHAGQGLSLEGQIPSHIDTYDTFVGDLERILQKLKAPRKDYPLFLMSHSMGGLIGTRFVQKHPGKVSGLILESPFFQFQVPEGITQEQFGQIINAYALPAPYGFDFANRCSKEFPVPVVAGLAQCLSDQGCRQCFEAPVADPRVIPGCEAIPLDWGALRGAWAYFQLPESIGCKAQQTLEKAKADCTFGADTFIGLSTDFDYCVYQRSHPLISPEATFGWMKASLEVQAQIRAELSQVTVPTLVLQSPIDPVAAPEAQATFCEALPHCTLKSYKPDPSRNLFYFHDLYTEKDRATLIRDTRNFLEQFIR